MNNLINPYTCNVFTMLRALTLLFSLLVSAQLFAETGIDASDATLPASDDIIHDGKISLSLRDVSIAEVMEMLSRSARVNILLSDDVKGEVSVNMYDVNVDEAIHSIATSGGYGVEKRK